MAIIVMVYGQSGTGKSASLRNFDSAKIAVINVSGKPMPFRTNLKTLNTDSYEKIDAAIYKTDRKSIIIDDATYLMVDEFMRTAKNTGYQKFTDMALNYFTLVERAAALPADRIVYFLGHSEMDANGNEKFKTIGKLLDEKVTLEGKYTHNNGQDTVKTPIGMFDSDLIPNDLAAVDKVIREYYGMEE